MPTTLFRGCVVYLIGPVDPGYDPVADAHHPEHHPQPVGEIYLKVIVDGCISNLSNEITVVVHPIPFPPAHQHEQPGLRRDTLIACATFVAGATYEWQAPSPARAAALPGPGPIGHQSLRQLPGAHAGHGYSPCPEVPADRQEQPVAADRVGQLRRT